MLLAPPSLTSAKPKYKSLKFLQFTARQAAGPAFRLEGLEPPPGGLVRELHESGAQLARGGGGVCNDGPALNHLRGDLRGLLAQVVEQLTQQCHARLLARLEPGALGRGDFARDGG